MKKCLECHVPKDDADFLKPNGKPSKKCQVCREKIAARERARWERLGKPRSTAEQNRARSLMYRHGMVESDVDDLLDAQGHRCLLCSKELTKKTLRIDHDHSCPNHDDERRTCSECRRGGLCDRCNMLVGFIEQNAELLPAAFAHVGWSI